MMVTFISQCEKNALKKTRRVLDAFANRIGDNTWQTVITQDGLTAVKKLLRQTASKSTAVSCHWIRSRSRTELLWIVGQKEKFNQQGLIPVNITEKSTSQYFDKHHWSSIPVIAQAAQIAGLFHDFGKANVLFQDKLNPDKKASAFEPYRHEWVSLRLFQAFVDDKNDQQWLEMMREFDPTESGSCFRDGIDEGFGKHPILDLPPFAQLVAWIIVSHHKLPLAPTWVDGVTAPALSNIKNWLKHDFEPVWNSYHCKNIEQADRIKDNWMFANKALPYFSFKWRSHASDIATETLKQLPHGHTIDYINDHLFTSHIARLCMMLADRHYSSQTETTQHWRGLNYSVYANTYRKDEPCTGVKQQLDEHLIGVARHSQKIVKALSRLNHSLPDLPDIPFLTTKVQRKCNDKMLVANYGWQDNTIKLTKKLGMDTSRHGFFGVNMASTGKGKTLANAKIMYTLGQQTGRTRFSVALGLRTLTLQTGREFQTRLGLNAENLAIAVGSTAVKQLFDLNNNQASAKPEQSTGSESADEQLCAETYIHYSGDTSHSLSEWTKQDPRINKLLHAPALVCTIDHLISATEGTRGGRQTAAMLRLLTSDLVLDEPDDFGLEDLPALCRLVHWAGTLGSRVLLSTATLPPAQAYALFESYRNGWQQFAKANIPDWKGDICCAWFDEFSTSDYSQRLIEDSKGYKTRHHYFIKQRTKNLRDTAIVGHPPKRLGKIALIQQDGKKTPAEALVSTIHSHIAQLHRHHSLSKNNKNVSIGLVRMANIDPLIGVAKQLLAMDAPDDTCIHWCVYHSRYPLAVRSHIEKHLDTILNRKNPDNIWQPDNTIHQTIEKYPQSHHIFVVMASPVAEVGRDHDYDWAIVEPSSMRSIIQLAGRVLRHRNAEPAEPNVILLNQNYKALNGKKLCFNRPGFETNELKLEHHELAKVLNPPQYQAINAIPRIAELTPQTLTEQNLNTLEHKSLAYQLFFSEKNAKVWWHSDQTASPYWCGEVQRQQPFRRSLNDEPYYLWLEHEYSAPRWRWLNQSAKPPAFGEKNNIQPAPAISQGRGMHFWLDQSPEAIYQQLGKELNMALSSISERFGELRVTEYSNTTNHEYYYQNQLGLYRQG